jgi:hypothetical protein
MQRIAASVCLVTIATFPLESNSLMLTGPISAALRVPSVSPFPTGKPDRGLLLRFVQRSTFRTGWNGWTSQPGQGPIPLGRRR